MALQKIAYRILAVLILVAPALYNGFPLVFSDTGTYILSGMEGKVPKDRPVMYGLFLAITSARFSLWPVVLAQGAILAFLLSKVMDVVSLSGHRPLRMLVFLCLSALTGVGWYCGQLMPDIFAACAVLSSFLLVERKKLDRIHIVVVSLLLILSVSVHYSHFLIVLLVCFFQLSKDRFARASLKKLALPGLLALGSLLLVSVTNKALGDSFRISNGGHVFMSARMLNSGVLESFLNDKCGTQNYALCKYKDALPKNGEAMMWDPASPVYQDGGWNATRGAYSEMVKDILTNPKYLGTFLYRSVFSSFSALFQNDVGGGLNSKWYRDPSSPPYTEIANHFPHEIRPYSISRQNGNLWGQELTFNTLNIVVNGVILFCLLFLVYRMVIHAKRLDCSMKTLLSLVVFTLLANALVVGTLASSYDRFQARVSWMLPMVVCLIIAKRIAQMSSRGNETP